jgi:hypothetical protein
VVGREFEDEDFDSMSSPIIGGGVACHELFEAELIDSMLLLSWLSSKLW